MELGRSSVESVCGLVLNETFRDRTSSTMNLQSCPALQMIGEETHENGRRQKMRKRWTTLCGSLATSASPWPLMHWDEWIVHGGVSRRNAGGGVTV